MLFECKLCWKELHKLKIKSSKLKMCMKQIYIEFTVCQLLISLSKPTKIHLPAVNLLTMLNTVRDWDRNYLFKPIPTCLLLFSCFHVLQDWQKAGVFCQHGLTNSQCLDPGHLCQLGHVLCPQLSKRTWRDIQLPCIAHTWWEGTSVSKEFLSPSLI